MPERDVRSRRRFLSIVASCAGLAWPALARAAATPEVTTWRGTALGAAASMTLVHPDRAQARACLRTCLDEVTRLEAILSLYRPDSAISRLNATRELHAPAHELVELLSFGLALSRASGGAFDPTVQPLYRLYAEHFATPRADGRGPSPHEIARVLRFVDFTAVEVRADRIRLRRPGMAITLNGIAQGYVTDRVSELLRASGFDNVLVDMGEARASGERPGGGTWRAALTDPRDPQRTFMEVRLGADAGGVHALATSAGYGTRFGSDPRIHHLLDPHTGRSANHYLSVSVAAQRTLLADGLSTTLSILPPARGLALLKDYPSARAYVVAGSGRIAVHGRV